MQKNIIIGILAVVVLFFLFRRNKKTVSGSTKQEPEAETSLAAKAWQWTTGGFMPTLTDPTGDTVTVPEILIHKVFPEEGTGPVIKYDGSLINPDINIKPAESSSTSETTTSPTPTVTTSTGPTKPGFSGKSVNWKKR